MRNLIILGSGRSGTSAVAGLFRNVPGVFYGYDVLSPSISNPRGYFECEVVNCINNVLVRQMTGTALLDLVPKPLLRYVEDRFSWMHRDTRSLWLACPRRPLPWRLGFEWGHLIGRLTEHRPFCLKDPRFSFTLPIWRPYLPDDTRFIVVFRDPETTVRSMLRDARALYDRPLALTEAWAIDHWNLAYESILKQQAAVSEDRSNWLFVDIADVVSGAAAPLIEAFADCEIDDGQIDPHLMTATPSGKGSAAAQACAAIYGQLRQIAEKAVAGRAKGPALTGADA